MNFLELKRKVFITVLSKARNRWLLNSLKFFLNVFKLIVGSNK